MPGAKEFGLTVKVVSTTSSFFSVLQYIVSTLLYDALHRRRDLAISEPQELQTSRYENLLFEKSSQFQVDQIFQETEERPNVHMKHSGR